MTKKKDTATVVKKSVSIPIKIDRASIRTSKSSQITHGVLEEFKKFVATHQDAFEIGMCLCLNHYSC